MSDHKPTCATVEHAAQDKAIHATYLHDQDVYRRTWPKHCAKCRGWGLHYDTYDPSPAGVSLSAGTMTDVSLCECVEGGICPRCAREPLEVKEDAYNGDWCFCVGCGWTETKTEGISEEPQLSECDCWGLDDVEQLEAGEATS